MRKKILIFIQNNFGGAEKVTIEIAKMLMSDDWKVAFCIYDFLPGVYTIRIKSIIPKGTEFCQLFSHSQIGILLNMYKIINRFAPSVVFCSAIQVNQRLLLLSSIFRDTRFIIRNDNYLYTISPLKQKILKYTYRLADMIISQTEEMEDELKGIGLPSKKVLTLHNPINKETLIKKASEQSPYPEKDGIIFVAVGRISRQKGFDILIDAFNIARQRIPKSKLYIVGNTDYEGGIEYRKLKQQIETLNLKNEVIFTGHQHNPYKYINYADVFVLSSRNEGLPNVLLEAQTLGKPCAAVKCIPVISRIVTNGVNGFLADSENSEDLADAMINALSLESINMTFHTATTEDFLLLFNRVLKL